MRDCHKTQSVKVQARYSPQRGLRSGYEGKGALPSMVRSHGRWSFQKKLDLKVLALSPAVCLNSTLLPTARITTSSTTKVRKDITWPEWLPQSGVDIQMGFWCWQVGIFHKPIKHKAMETKPWLTGFQVWTSWGKKTTHLKIQSNFFIHFTKFIGLGGFIVFSSFFLTFTLFCYFFLSSRSFLLFYLILFFYFHFSVEFFILLFFLLTFPMFNFSNFNFFILNLCLHQYNYKLDQSLK